jgi:hypothetical protein
MPKWKTGLEGDLEKVKNIKGPGIVGALFPSYAAPYLRDQTLGIKNPMLRLHGQVVQRGLQAGTRLSGNVGKAAVAAQGLAGLPLVAAAAPAVGTAAKTTASTAALKAAVRFPRITAFFTAIAGGFAGIQGDAGTKLRTVTSWATKGITPDLNPGRWVMLGRPTILNFILSGLAGPKAFPSSRFPFLRFEWVRVPFSNSVTGNLPQSALQWPRAWWEAWKGILGQRQIKE